MTDYQRGLADAAAACRAEARACWPWWRWRDGIGRMKSVARWNQARMAIRCARAIEAIKEG